MYVTLTASPLLLSLHPTPLGAILFAPTTPVIAAIVVVAIFVIGTALRGGAYLHRRRGEINAMASRLGLQPWPDNSLPRGLSLEGTLFHQPHRLTNVHHGIINRCEVVILDIQKAEPKSRWSRTILAVKTRDHIHAPASLESRNAGPWRLIYSPVRLSGSAELMEIDVLESLLRNIIP